MTYPMFSQSQSPFPFAEKRETVIHLNMTRAKQIYDLANSDPFISICKTKRREFVFEGGISVTWTDDDHVMKEFEESSVQLELLALLNKCLAYRDMFGFCPIKIFMDQQGRRRATIPEFGTGHFVLLYDTKNHQSKVVFVSKRSASDFYPTSYQKVKPEKNVYVFVWPDGQPSLNENGFRSRIFLLLERYYELREYSDNALYADANSSHPTIFSQRRADAKKMSEYTETELFGEFSCGGDLQIDAEEQRGYRRNVMRSRAMEYSLSHTSGGGFDANFTRKRVDETTGRVTEFNRKAVWEDHMYILPEGEEMARTIFPQSRSDLLQIKNEFIDIVCLTLGFPRSFIQGIGHSRFKTDSNEEIARMRSTIRSDRADCEMFYQFVYQMMYGENDNKNLVTALMQKREEIQQIKESPQTTETELTLQNAKDTKKRLKKTIVTPTRIHLLFLGDPLVSFYPLNTITTAANMGATDSLETINILRNLLGLKAVKEDDKLVIEAEKQKLLAKEVKSKKEHEHEHEQEQTQTKKVSKTKGENEKRKEIEEEEEKEEQHASKKQRTEKTEK